MTHLEYGAAAPGAASVVAAGPDGAGVGVDERRLGDGERLLEARLAVDLAVGAVHGLSGRGGGRGVQFCHKSQSNFFNSSCYVPLADCLIL